jgi:hypothetical protein
LAVPRGRIVVVPEYVEQLPIANLGRIVFHLHGFGVSGAVGAHVFVVRVSERSARVTHGCRNHAFDLPERCLDTPKTPGAERGFIRLHGADSHDGQLGRHPYEN